MIQNMQGLQLQHGIWEELIAVWVSGEDRSNPATGTMRTTLAQRQAGVFYALRKTRTNTTPLRTNIHNCKQLWYISTVIYGRSRIGENFVEGMGVVKREVQSLPFKTALDDTSVSRSCLIIHSRQQLIVDLLVDTQYMYDL